MAAAQATGGDVRGSSGMSARGHELAFVVVALLLGIGDALFLIGWHAIDPRNADWIRSDPGQFYAGWEFLRRELWTLPPTWLSKLDYPFGISAAYLDVIPIVAVPMKLCSILLPPTFQFFGVYLAFCLVLQSYFAIRLLNQFTPELSVIMIGALFFLNAPILLSRIYVHFSLSAQWLILAALFCYFRSFRPQQPSRYLLPFLLLVFVAGGFSPYLSVMILFVAFAAVLRARLGPGTERLMPWRPMLGWAVGLLFCTAMSFFVFGFLSFSVTRSLPGDGYTMFSLDLLSPFDRWDYLPGPGYEGYNYLGAGVFLLLFVTLAVQPDLLKRMWTTSRPLVLMSLVLTILALSPRVTLGQRPLFLMHLPTFIWQALAVFRGSGRLFWPVTYLLLLAAVIGPLHALKRRSLQISLLLGALVIQTFDLASVREAAAQQFRAAVVDPLTSSEWSKLGASYIHLVVVPAWQCSLTATPGGDAGWQWFARLAARNGMTLNSVHAARSLTQSKLYNCYFLPRSIGEGKLDPSTAYVLGDQLARLAVVRNHSNTCRRVNGFNLCTATEEK